MNEGKTFLLVSCLMGWFMENFVEVWVLGA